MRSIIYGVDAIREVVHKYRSDFLVRLVCDEMLILKTKDEGSEQDRVKYCYLDEWVKAVNAHGGFGHWRWAVVRRAGEIRDVLMKNGGGKG